MNIALNIFREQWIISEIASLTSSGHFFAVSDAWWRKCWLTGDSAECITVVHCHWRGVTPETNQSLQISRLTSSKVVATILQSQQIFNCQRMSLDSLSHWFLTFVCFFRFWHEPKFQKSPFFLNFLWQKLWLNVISSYPFGWPPPPPSSGAANLVSCGSAAAGSDVRLLNRRIAVVAFDAVVVALNSSGHGHYHSYQRLLTV